MLLYPSETAAVLRGAATLLEKPGAWNAPDDALDTEDCVVDPCLRGTAVPAVRWSAAGAIRRIAEGAGLDGTGTVVVVMDAYRLAAEAAGLTIAGFGAWHDQPGRTAAEITEILRKAEYLAGAGTGPDPGEATGTAAVGERCDPEDAPGTPAAAALNAYAAWDAADRDAGRPAGPDSYAAEADERRATARLLRSTRDTAWRRLHEDARTALTARWRHVFPREYIHRWNGKLPPGRTDYAPWPKAKSAGWAAGTAVPGPPAAERARSAEA